MKYFTSLACFFLLCFIIMADAPGPAGAGQARQPEGDVTFQGKDLTVLMNAAYHCDNAGVGRFLQGGADVNKKQAGSGHTALHYAIRGGCAATAELLIKSGAELRTVDAQGYTPLEYSVYCRQPGVLQVLAVNGADLEQQSKSGTALALAAMLGYKAEAEVLMRNGADPNRTIDGVSPLIFAVVGGHTELVKIMVEQFGGDTKCRLPNGENMTFLTKPGGAMEKLLASYGVFPKKLAAVQLKPVTPTAKPAPEADLAARRRAQLQAANRDSGSEVYRKQEAADPRLKAAREKKARDAQARHEDDEREEAARQKRLQQERQQQAEAERQRQRSPKQCYIYWNEQVIGAQKLLAQEGGFDRYGCIPQREAVPNEAAARAYMRENYQKAREGGWLPEGINERNIGVFRCE